MKIQQIIKHLILLLVILQANASKHLIADEISTDKQTLANQEKSLTIKSKLLQQTRELLVRLPNDYQKSELAYPVLYVLNANDFFIGDIFEQTVALVQRLETVNDMPPTIVIGIQSKQWYTDAIINPEPFEGFVSREVPELINSKFRTLPNKILVGHSYAGAFVSGAMPVKEESFDLFLTLSPVYPNMAYVEKIIKRYKQLTPLNAQLKIIDGDEGQLDKRILKKAASRLSKDVLKLDYHSLNLESHMSVYSMGLNHALREHFSDYRAPNRHDVNNSSYDLAKLKAYFLAKDNKYGTSTNEATLKSSAISMAHKYTSMLKIQQALPFWRYGESKFKEYFMFGYAERFIAMGEIDMAITLWKEMLILFPESDKNYSQLIKEQETNN